MDQVLTSLPTPVRATTSDEPEEILAFALAALQGGGKIALATLVDIRGGAARALGSQLAVASDGRFCGYVSGGCVEAAVACEALMALEEGRDRIVKFGKGSPFFDIALPCGGGITIAIHVLRDGRLVDGILKSLQARETGALCYSPDEHLLDRICPPSQSGWYDKDFKILYRPRTRIAVSGGNAEAHAVSAIAKACGFDVIETNGNEQNLLAAIDEMTAVVLLHHDLDAEERVLGAALRSRAFYVGALGSTRTHKRREERLCLAGWSKTEINRIKAPIGFFGPTRDASSLALSVLADVAAARLAAYG
ncbi:XdhC family protein [Pararhizobium sp. DWP3-4]|uniref:XdhC family protein n=1 Tax=unclassified Pararhizobium TaxID=2643050 RepID=UPI003CF511BF